MKKRSRGINSKTKKTEAALRAFALRFPGAREEFPWGERVVKVGKKVFVFMGTADDGGFGLSVKLRTIGRPVAAARDALSRFDRGEAPSVYSPLRVK